MFSRVRDSIAMSRDKPNPLFTPITPIKDDRVHKEIQRRMLEKKYESSPNLVRKKEAKPISQVAIDVMTLEISHTIQGTWWTTGWLGSRYGAQPDSADESREDERTSGVLRIHDTTRIFTKFTIRFRTKKYAGPEGYLFDTYDFAPSRCGSCYATNSAHQRIRHSDNCQQNW